MLVVNLVLCTAYLLSGGKTFIIPNQTENLILSRVVINKFTQSLALHKFVNVYLLFAKSRRITIKTKKLL